MNRWFALVLFFPILILSVSLVVLAAYKNSAYEEFMQLKLNSVMNNANDAALFTARETGTVNNAGNIQLNPDDMWDTYKAVFLSSFGIYDEYHCNVFESYTPAVLVAVNDGYFLKMRYDENGETGYRFTQKLPYSVMYNNEGTEYIVSAAMNRKNEYALNPSASPTLEFYENGYSALSDKQVSAEINDYLIKGMQTMTAAASPISKQRFFVPTQLTEKAEDEAVNYKGLCMMVTVQGFDLFTKNAIESFTVSNTQMTEAKEIYCYSTDNGRYYTNKKVDSDDWILEKVVKDIYTAAKNGYYPHPRYYS